jgi:hypothetical protein
MQMFGVVKELSIHTEIKGVRNRGFRSRIIIF